MPQGEKERESFTHMLSGRSTKGKAQTDKNQRSRCRAVSPTEKEWEESKTLSSGE